MSDICRLTFDVRGRRSGEAAKGTHKRSLWAVPLDGVVMRFAAALSVVAHEFLEQEKSAAFVYPELDPVFL